MQGQHVSWSGGAKTKELEKANQRAWQCLLASKGRPEAGAIQQYLTSAC